MVRLSASGSKGHASCQCDWKLRDWTGQLADFTEDCFISCKQDITQEDLLCDYCRMNYGKLHGHKLDPGFA